jgi:hypothetical protein
LFWQAEVQDGLPRRRWLLGCREGCKPSLDVPPLLLMLRMGAAVSQAAMEARDKERLDRMAKEAQERAAANAAKKKKAEERIAGAGKLNSTPGLLWGCALCICTFCSGVCCCSKCVKFGDEQAVVAAVLPLCSCPGHEHQDLAPEARRL